MDVHGDRKKTLGARDFLSKNVQREMEVSCGLRDERYLGYVVDSWMDDENNSKHRFCEIKKNLPEAKRILDLSAGCGTTLFLGLKLGYDMHGIEPERWKLDFMSMKSMENGYPADWIQHVSKAFGEALPYKDNSFDCVTTYQTLEHIKGYRLVLKEMIRVTKVGGGIHIRCPDYWGTFEPHYRLAWLPLMPRFFAKVWLKLRGRPTRGLDTITYITLSSIKKFLRNIENQVGGLKLSVIDCSREEFEERMLGRIWERIPFSWQLFKMKLYFKRLFRQETYVNIFVRIFEK